MKHVTIVGSRQRADRPPMRPADARRARRCSPAEAAADPSSADADQERRGRHQRDQAFLCATRQRRAVLLLHGGMSNSDYW